jgi:hypothetical protein
MENEEELDKSMNELFDSIADGSLILIDSVGEVDNPKNNEEVTENTEEIEVSKDEEKVDEKVEDPKNNEEVTENTEEIEVSKNEKKVDEKVKDSHQEEWARSVRYYMLCFLPLFFFFWQGP